MLEEITEMTSQSQAGLPNQQRPPRYNKLPASSHGVSFDADEERHQPASAASYLDNKKSFRTQGQSRPIQHFVQDPNYYEESTHKLGRPNERNMLPPKIKTHGYRPSNEGLNGHQNFHSDEDESNAARKDYFGPVRIKRLFFAFVLLFFIFSR